jgi:AcrR family transcriptional regulator
MLSRRDRARAATVREIKQTARRIVLERGPQAASLRAVAREVGMTAPGLYRYFASRQELLNHVAADILTDLVGDINAAVNEAGAPGEADPADRLAAACWEFRRWSLSHRAAFGMLFGAPAPSWNVEQDTVAAGSSQKFAGAFLDPFVELWRTGLFPVPADDEIDLGLRGQLERYRSLAKADLPLGAVLVFLCCWVRLYGSIATEVFGQPGFALADPEPTFQLTPAETLPLAGLRCPSWRPGRSPHLAPETQPRLAARSKPRPPRSAQEESPAEPGRVTANQAAS